MTMLFDAMVREKSYYLICFMVDIVIENYCRPSIIMSHFKLVEILNKMPDIIY